MKLISHRGNDDHNNKENSVKAIKYSLRKNYIDGVEIDIRLTKDNKIILYHDNFINGKLVSLLKYKDIRKIDKNIVLFNKFLKEIKTNKIILIELKNSVVKEKIFCDQVYKLLNRYPKNYYICSFDYSLLNRLKEKMIKYPLGVIAGKIINNTIKYNYDFVNIYYKSYSDNKKDKFVWTINNIRNIENFKNKDVFIITDNAYKFKVL